MTADIRSGSQGFKRYFANTSWLIGARVLNMATALLVGIYVARYLGPVRLGVLSFSASYVNLFAALANLGLDNIVIRELVSAPDRREVLLGTAFWLKTSGAVAMWAVVAGTLPVLGTDAQTNTVIVILVLGVAFQSFDVIDLYYQSTVASKFTVYAQITRLAVSSAVKLLLVGLAAELLWFAGVFIFDAGVFALAQALIFSRQGGHSIRAWRWCGATAKTLLKDAWPLMLSVAVYSVYMGIDQVMIKQMLGLSDVGHYSAAVKLSSACHFIPAAVCSSLFPALVHVRKTDRAIYHQRLLTLYSFMVWLGILIALPTTLLSSGLITALYGVSFSPAAPVLAIHIWGAVFIFLGYANGRWIVAENIQYISAVRNMAGCLINILLNTVFIPQIGIRGAALATLVSVMVSFHIIFLFFKETREAFRIQNEAFIRPVLKGAGLLRSSMGKRTPKG